jgi:hypothetical protein
MMAADPPIGQLLQPHAKACGLPCFPPSTSFREGGFVFYVCTKEEQGFWLLVATRSLLMVFALKRILCFAR